MRRSIRRWLLFGSGTLVVAALVAAVGLAWYLREQRATYFTDDDTIRRPIATAAPRDVLWRPPAELSAIVNTPGDEFGPTLGPDGATLYFVRGRAGQGTDIYASVKTPTGWSRPEPLTAVNTGADELDPAPSPDGGALYFASNRPGGHGHYDLWVSRRDGDRWTPPVNLGPRVNTRFDETGPGLTPDGVRLYFASNRPRPADGAEPPAPAPGLPPAPGDSDLFAIALDGTARAAPVDELNTGHDESGPSVSPAGDFVYFTSDRPGGEGGFDLYRARRLDGAHAAPRNLGPPVNTPADELDPAVSLEGFGLHYAAHAGDGAGYDVRYTTSREVFTRTDSYRASLDWAALWAMLWPYLLGTFLAALLLLALISTFQRLQYRRLTLLAKCLLVSLLVHLLLMITFAFWSVSAGRADRNRPGRGVRVVLTSPSIGAGLAAQIRGGLTRVEIEADLPQPAAARQRRDTAASLAPVAVTMPRVAAADVAPSPVDTPGAPAIATAREAATRSAELPEPDLAATAVEAVEPLTVAVPTEAARSVGAEAVVAVRVGAPAPAEAERAPAASLSGAPTAPLVTVAPAAIDAAAGASAPLAPAAAPRDATARAPAPAVAARPAPERRVDLDLPAMPSAGPARAVEVGLEVAAAMPSARAVDVALPVATPPGQAAPRADDTLLAAAVDLAPEGPAPVGGRDAPSRETLAVPVEAAPSRGADAVAFDLPALEEAPAVAQAAPGEATEPVAAPAGLLRRAERAAWSPEPGPVAPPAAAAASAVAPAPRAIERPGAPSAASLDAAAARDARSVPEPAATAAAIDVPPPAPLALDLPWLDDAPAASEPEATPRPAFAVPPSKRAHQAPLLADADARADDRRPEVPLPAVEVARDGPVADLDVPDADTPRPDLADPAPVVLASLDLDLALPTQIAPPPNPYAQRAPERREKLLEEMGGSAETERAVAMALDWLARHQSRNGRWDGDHFDDRCGRCGGTQRVKCDIALTGLSVLCFTAADHTHVKDGPYQQNVERAVTWLLSQQDDDGGLFRDESMYSHGIATIALAEAYGMTGDERLARPVKAAVDFIYRARNETVGGWRYRPGQMGDTSVLGWQIMALTSAKRARIDVPEEAFSVARHWLDLVERDSRPGLYAYQPRRQVTPAMTAEGMFVRQLLGTTRDDPRMSGSASYVLRHPPRWNPDANTYYWYYATLALFQHQGGPWQRWNERVTDVLLAHQRTAGPAAGSWDPQGQWAEVAGRVYQTAMATLTLEVYYRYLPSFVGPWGQSLNSE